MQAIFFLLIILVMLYGFYTLILDNKKTQTISTEFSGKLRETILTDTELKFYNQLRAVLPVTYTVQYKVRIADIIKTDNMRDFNKIKSKHIDFIIVNSKSNIIELIELDDYTHNYKKNIEKDNFKNMIFKSLNKEIIRYKVTGIYDFTSLLEKLNTANY